MTEAARGARDRMAAMAEARTRIAGLERALDAADRSIAEFEPTDEPARTARERWAREAATLRSKTTPLAGLPAGRQRKVAGDLRRRTNALLDEIVAYGLAPRRRRRRGGRA